MNKAHRLKKWIWSVVILLAVVLASYSALPWYSAAQLVDLELSKNPNSEN